MKQLTLNDPYAFLRMIRANIPFFSEFTDREMMIFHERGEFISYNKGEAIIKEEELDTGLFVIIHGEAEVFKDGRIVATLGPGDSLGEMGIIAGIPRTAEVRSKMDDIVLKLNPAILKAGDCNFQLKLYRRLAAILADRLAQATARI